MTIWKTRIHLDRVKRIWYLSPMRAAKVQASLRIRAVSPEPPLLAHTSSESRGTFRQKARSLASVNGWACAVKPCHDGMLEDTNSLDGAHLLSYCFCCEFIKQALNSYLKDLLPIKFSMITLFKPFLWQHVTWLFHVISVDKKEHKAGHDPEQELKDSGFHDVGRV